MRTAVRRDVDTGMDYNENIVKMKMLLKNIEFICEYASCLHPTLSRHRLENGNHSLATKL